MPRHRLTIILLSTLVLASALDAALMVALAVLHKPFIIPLAGAVAAFTPGIVAVSMVRRRRLSR
jgi:hypothetical protein